MNTRKSNHLLIKLMFKGNKDIEDHKKVNSVREHPLPELQNSNVAKAEHSDLRSDFGKKNIYI